jgi:hypothetical protein
MTVTWERRVSDGEELVIEETQESLHASFEFEVDPRARAIDRRSQALSEGARPQRAGMPGQGPRT